MPLVGSPASVNILARPIPRTPPIAATSTDSIKTSASTDASVNPTVLRMASSPVRSRTEVAMVLPVTSSRVKNTTLPMANMRNSMLPICSTNEAMNADSDCVRVSQAEFANSSSMALATFTLSDAGGDAHGVPAHVVLAPRAGPSPSGSPTGTRTA